MGNIIKNTIVMFILLMALMPMTGEELTIRKNGKYIKTIDIYPYEIYKIYDFFYVYNNEKEIDYRTVGNKLYVNGALRELEIKSNEDFEMIEDETDHFVINMENAVDFTILKKVNKPIFLKIKKINKKDLYKIKELKNTEALDLYYCSDVNNDTVSLISNLTSLKYLNLSHTNVGNEGIKHLKSYRKLLHLDVSDLKIDDGAVDIIAGLSSLTYLNLGGTKITARGLRNLGNMTKLKILELPDLKLNDESFDFLVYLSRVTELNIKNNHISDDSMKKISSLKNLTALNISWTRITDSGISQIVDLQRLRRIVLDGTKIKDESMKYLGRLKRLEFLSLADTRITEEGLFHITGLDNLEYLNVRRTGIITGQGELNNRDEVRGYLKLHTDFFKEGLCASISGLRQEKGFETLPMAVINKNEELKILFIDANVYDNLCIAKKNNKGLSEGTELIIIEKNKDNLLAAYRLGEETRIIRLNTNETETVNGFAYVKTGNNARGWVALNYIIKK